MWSDNPLSVYAKALTTIVDGTVYYDVQTDLALRKEIQAERNRIIQKMIGEKKNGGPVRPATPSFHQVNLCGDHEGHHDMLAAADDDALTQ